MNKEQLISQIKQKKVDQLVGKALKEPKIIAVAFKVMETESSAVKFGAEKVIRLVSEKSPKLVYPYFDRLVKMTAHENSFLKWGAYLTLANLAVVDKKNKFEKIFADYFKPITGPEMVTAANIVGGAAKIAQAKPKLADRIAKEILKVEKGIYKHKEKV
ncbi:hypothetical protein KKA01_02390, partial [Patescibacteria group bacterium]|nr:hypothetical protein [Patescibacteria group bacterium]